MKYVLLLLTLILSTAQANLQATYRNNLLINPNTNQPYTGNLETINNNWGKDAVEYSQEYVNGLRHGSEKAFYKTGALKSEGNFNKGTIEGVVSLYFEDGSLMGRVDMANNIKEGRGCSGPLILDTFQATFSNSAIF